MPASTQQELQKLRNVHLKLSQMSQHSYQKIQIQKQIYQDLSKILSKFSLKINQLSKRINQQILSPSSSAYIQQSVIHHYQFLSNSLLKFGQCIKKISNNQKQQVLQPMKIFMVNYKNISDQLLNQINTNTNKISQNHIQLNKIKQNYYNIAEKFQKSRDMQAKVMMKIQNGDKNQLEKFNLQIKKFSSSIISTQSLYKQHVSKINQQWQYTKKSLQQSLTSFSNNQQARVSFSKRTVLSTLKLLEQIQNGFIKDSDTKLKQALKVQKNQRNIYFQAKVYQWFKEIKNTTQLQQFLTHEEYKKKQKRIQTTEQQHLQEIFKKVRNQDKQKIKQFVEPWFLTDNQNKKMQQSDSTQTSQNNNRSSNSQNNSKQSPKQLSSSKSKKSLIPKPSPISTSINQQTLDTIKCKIIQALPYSFYFIQQLFTHILTMPTFYCKLSDDQFYYLLNTFNMITKSITINVNSDINTQFLYKMIIISQKITWKKSKINNKDKNIELLCTYYAKNKQIFTNKKTLMSILNYLMKKKSDKKKTTENYKNTFSSITKNIFSRKKDKQQLLLSSDQHFDCLLQLTNIMSSLNVPNQISLTLIKQSLNDQNKSTALNYLKGIILSKKDIEERRKIFFKTEVKQKRQKQLKYVIQNKKIAQFCINITARKGFFTQDQITLRLVSKYLKNVHWIILSRIDMTTTKKWLHLLPYDRKMQYIQMKQQVAQKSVPSATQQIITLDVNRSLHIHGQSLNPTILHTLLRIYAFYHKDISYCQGMNYIAGYIYLKTLNEQSAYRIFEYLMQIRFKQLFANEFEILKIKMYQFERLLSIFHPEISQHFKKQSVSPQCYIVSWIITIFASSYQYTMQSYIIDKIWEKFIISGWKQFFKFILWIFDLKKEQLIELTYDRALHCLGEIAKSRFILASNKEYAVEFKHYQCIEDGMAKFQVTEELLQSLVKQYKLLK